ncbi:cysteine hydrolase [Cutibacterium sp. WCA-380-WT-3A]|uniref:Cysteine hydrolase n=1 Tax=Cutibacterium porci TaxID=2605781 RepID=A0A7K0J9U3_9ACTN|nr:isochorismatase family cysteine hydrolase [Cutibacterium porci]MSS46716.1 cysteine hydrolase [Cutibacterium porci]
MFLIVPEEETSMAIQLDPRTALIVVDLQKGILAMTPADAVADLVQANTRLADAFHAAGLPVVWVHATGLPPGRVARPVPEPDELPADFTVLHDDLPVAGSDIHLGKPRTMSSFARTDLAEQLRNRGITQVVVTGIATGAGVESTARSAYDEGFHVIVVSDATLDGNLARHSATLQEAIPSIGYVASTDEIVAALPR